jgi:pimeloyl-ACP methyl ester carboxylesterase
MIKSSSVLSLVSWASWWLTLLLSTLIPLTLADSDLSAQGFTRLTSQVAISSSSKLTFEPSGDLNTAIQKKLTVTPCYIDGIKTLLNCYNLRVPENYQDKKSRVTNIHFIVLPAIDSSKNKIPLMILAGGPGQAAAELAAGIDNVFAEVRKTHDIILIDQRGTGKSRPLTCPQISPDKTYQLTPEDFSDQEIYDCINKMGNDLAPGALQYYNSENAIRDFEQVRSALGHEYINIYGASYGTRTGLLYMRMYPKVIRSIVLDGVAPLEVPIGLFGKTSAKSFDLLISHCQKSIACQQAYPNLLSEFEQILIRLEKSPITVTIPHPRLGSAIDFNISKAKFIGTIRQQLYTKNMRKLVPLVIHQVYLNNYLPLAGLIATTDNSEGMYIGLYFNIVCNEDFPRISHSMFRDDAENSFGGDDSHLTIKKVCELWPSYVPTKSLFEGGNIESESAGNVQNVENEIISKNIPTLIFSGELDPVTPPSNGERVAQKQIISRHIVVNNASHGVAKASCAMNIIDEFLTTLQPHELDASCLDEVTAESFMHSLNGGE